MHRHAANRESRTVCCEATVSEHTQFPGASALQAWEQLLMAAFRPECRQLLGQSKKSSRTKVALRPFTELSTNRGCPQILVGLVSLYASVIESCMYVKCLCLKVVHVC
jgi:hypothetical protein